MKVLCEMNKTAPLGTALYFRKRRWNKKHVYSVLVIK